MPLVPPTNDQHFPDKLLPHRQEWYCRDGAPPAWLRTFAVGVTGAEVLTAVNTACASLGITSIDPRYFVGTCFHESGCTNEWDIEIATASSPNGFQSVGAYQIGDEEAQRYGFMLTDMLDFDKATECMVRLARDNMMGLIAAPSTHASTHDYTDAKGTFWKDGGLRAYMAIAHNHGMGYARETIKDYGLNWAAYKARNPQDNIVSHSYGEDCVTGGSWYPG